jgi:hypothetical protein
VVGQPPARLCLSFLEGAFVLCKTQIYFLQIREILAQETEGLLELPAVADQLQKRFLKCADGLLDLLCLFVMSLEFFRGPSWINGLFRESPH